MQSEILIARDSESKTAILSVLSRNSYGPIGNMFRNYSIRDTIQNFFNKLVFEGVIAFQESKPGYTLFKVKGIDEIQKVSSLLYIPEVDFLFGTHKDEPTIEDLLILAAKKNDIEIPIHLGSEGLRTTSERNRMIASYIVLAIGLANSPRVVVPTMLGVAVAASLKETYDITNQDSPTPKLR